MVEYVFARRDFVAEDEGEIALRAGERIEVIEKDELYDDGWWQVRSFSWCFHLSFKTFLCRGFATFPSFYLLRRWLRQFNFRYLQGRNPAGEVGLFPKSHIHPARPRTKPFTTTRTRRPFSGPKATMYHTSQHRAVVPATASLSSESVLVDKGQPSTSSLPSIRLSQLGRAQERTRHTDTVVDATQNQSTATGNGEVMRATMTDVQQVIQQLRHQDDLDGSLSLSFAFSSDESTACDTDHDTDTDTDADVDGDGDDWHKSDRQKLTQKAKKVAQEQVARHVIADRVTLRPPIDLELSDDSWDEEDWSSGESSPGIGRKQPHLSEEEEVDTAAPHQVDHKPPHYSSIHPYERYIAPSSLTEYGVIEDSASGTFAATATQPLFSKNETVRTSENNNSLLSPVLPGLRGISNRVSAKHLFSAPLVFPSTTQTLGLHEVVDIRSIPFPFPSGTGHGHASRSSVATSAFITNSSLFSASTRSTAFVYRNSRDVVLVEQNDVVEWNVEEVVDWLRAKGFDDMVCDKFIEQRVRGDALLELDMGVLKSEIGIVGYGTRIRIMNAILELRRLSSVPSCEAPTHPESLFRGSSLARQACSSSTSLFTAIGIPASPESPDLGVAEQLSEPSHEGSNSDGRPKGETRRAPSMSEVRSIRYTSLSFR